MKVLAKEVTSQNGRFSLLYAHPGAGKSSSIIQIVLDLILNIQKKCRKPKLCSDSSKKLTPELKERG